MIKIKRGKCRLRGSGAKLIAELAIAYINVVELLAECGVPKDKAEEMVNAAIDFAKNETALSDES